MLPSSKPDRKKRVLFTNEEDDIIRSFVKTFGSKHCKFIENAFIHELHASIENNGTLSSR
jgi:hypothetical protein